MCYWITLQTSNKEIISNNNNNNNNKNTVIQTSPTIQKKPNKNIPTLTEQGLVEVSQSLNYPPKTLPQMTNT